MNNTSSGTLTSDWDATTQKTPIEKKRPALTGRRDLQHQFDSMAKNFTDVLSVCSKIWVFRSVYTHKLANNIRDFGSETTQSTHTTEPRYRIDVQMQLASRGTPAQKSRTATEQFREIQAMNGLVPIPNNSQNRHINPQEQVSKP